MARIKLTKNELKKQKDALARFERYLPTLALKKQQLQMEIRKIDVLLVEIKKAWQANEADLHHWIELFCEPMDFDGLLRIDNVEIEEGNIAGIDIPIFKSVEIGENEYDLFAAPLWVDKAIAILRKQITLQVQLTILEKQRQLLGDELRVTSQRVNLFEKVKIVEAKENIRVIKIYLGDQQTAAVVRGKISKKKIEKVS